MSWGRKVGNSQPKNVKGHSMCSLATEPSFLFTDKSHEYEYVNV